MAIVDIAFNCGCGKVVKTVEEAVVHADDLRHTLTVQGTVRSSERKVKTPKVREYPRTRAKKQAAATLAAVRAVEEADFNSLRTRLQRK